ncbi:MAG: DUF1045 domain-containing protein [Pseudomonadota bacterium]
MTDPKATPQPALAEGYARYAVYFTPAGGSALATLSAAWLGWDAEAQVERPAPDALPSLAVPHGDLVSQARRYGFHATLKAPFRLAEGHGAAALDQAAIAFAAGQRAFEIPALAVTALGPFLALCPPEPCAPLDALAGAVVRAFEPLRAPLSEADLAKRRTSPLSAAQDALLVEWGYPYVFDEFHFHMTLTRAIPDAEARERVHAALSGLFAPVLAAPIPVREIAIFGDPGADSSGGARPFHLLKRYPLTG